MFVVMLEGASGAAGAGWRKPSTEDGAFAGSEMQVMERQEESDEELSKQVQELVRSRNVKLGAKPLGREEARRLYDQAVVLQKEGYRRGWYGTTREGLLDELDGVVMGLRDELASAPQKTEVSVRSVSDTPASPSPVERATNMEEIAAKIAWLQAEKMTQVGNETTSQSEREPVEMSVTAPTRTPEVVEVSEMGVVQTVDEEEATVGEVMETSESEGGREIVVPMEWQGQTLDIRDVMTGKVWRGVVMGNALRVGEAAHFMVETTNDSDDGERVTSAVESVSMVDGKLVVRTGNSVYEIAMTEFVSEANDIQTETEMMIQQWQQEWQEHKREADRLEAVVTESWQKVRRQSPDDPTDYFSSMRVAQDEYLQHLHQAQELELKLAGVGIKVGKMQDEVVSVPENSGEVMTAGIYRSAAEDGGGAGGVETVEVPVKRVPEAPVVQGPVQVEMKAEGDKTAAMNQEIVLEALRQLSKSQEEVARLSRMVAELDEKWGRAAQEGTQNQLRQYERLVDTMQEQMKVVPSLRLDLSGASQEVMSGGTIVPGAEMSARQAMETPMVASTEPERKIVSEREQLAQEISMWRTVMRQAEQAFYLPSDLNDMLTLGLRGVTLEELTTESVREQVRNILANIDAKAEKVIEKKEQQERAIAQINREAQVLSDMMRKEADLGRLSEATDAFARLLRQAGFDHEAKIITTVAGDVAVDKTKQAGVELFARFLREQLPYLQPQMTSWEKQWQDKQVLLPLEERVDLILRAKEASLKSKPLLERWKQLKSEESAA